MLQTLFDQASRQTPSGYISALRGQGYDFINHASNTFVSCLTKPDSDEVVIINLDMDWAPLFYQYCRDNPDNPFLPTVRELTLQKDCCVVRMEKLQALDHVDLNASSQKALEDHAANWVAYIRNEGPVPAKAAGDAALVRQTVSDILYLSQQLYQRTQGRVLAYCDLKADNVFLRQTDAGNQFVYGDPLYPGWNEDNLGFMNGVYRSFGLAELKPKSKMDMVLEPAA